MGATSLAMKSQQRSIFDAMPHIEYVAQQGEDIWEMTVNAGIEAMQSLDDRKWQVGDLALKIVNFYGGRAPRGSDLIGDYALAIHADPARVREYLTVARFWTPDHRDEMLALPTLTYTHLRDAMRFGDMASAKDFLYRCADACWTVLEARLRIAEALGKTPTKRKVMTASATLIQNAGKMHLFQVHQNPDEKWIQLEIGTTYQIAIYRMENN